ncbi:MAG: (2,3-dihydroxybenzoyl)adenylate synthase [Pseudonocardiaceae bacterium]
MLEGCVPWPPTLAQSYRDRGYWRGVTLGTVLRSAAAAFGDRTMLVHGPRRVSYTALDAWADRLATGFARYGIKADERVVVQLPNVPEFVAVSFALFRLGAKPVFALVAHRATEIRHLCELSGASAYVVPDAHPGFDHIALARQVRDEVESVRSVFVLGESAEDVISLSELSELSRLDGAAMELPEPDPTDVAFFLFSGGTTALPKLIPRTHDDYAYQSLLAAEVCDLSTEDVYLAALPIGFNFAWGCPGVLGTLQAGATVVLADSPNPGGCFPLIEREGVTVTSLVPSITQIWLDVAEWTESDLSSLRLVQVGGAPMARNLASRIEPILGCKLQQVFGMAEGLLTFSRPGDPSESVLSTQGKPISPADELKILDEREQELPVGAVGELVTRGPYTLRGYYQAPEYNRRAFTEDGFYRTGDLARLTEDGELIIEGRIKDMVIRGGDKISTGEVENHLLAHPAVAAVAVIGVADDFLGERICAYVIPRGAPPTLTELRKSMRERGVAEYKLPDRVELVDSFPTTPLGKIDKKALARRP